jgi:hypothetical protein
MLLQDLIKRKIKTAFIVLIITLSSFLFIGKAFAETISPFSTEITLTSGEKSNQSVTITNENNYELLLTPKVYKYYPQLEYISEPQSFEKFIEIDNDYIAIPANSEIAINFQIVAPPSLEIGTYYNLIAFENTNKNQQSDPIIGAIGEISHIVKLDIISDNNLEQITDDYDVNLEIIDRGIPFIKPTKLKFTFFNNSQYTLIPKGEVQVVKKSGNKEPEYFKINLDRTRVFPEQSLEEEFEIKNWYIEDIFFGKTVYLRVENGLDSNLTTEEISIPGFKNEIIYVLATMTIIALLAFSLKNNSKAEPESSE